MEVEIKHADQNKKIESYLKTEEPKDIALDH